jgi:hypothetical protein
MGKEEKKKFFLENHFELATKGLIQDWLATYNKVVSFRLNSRYGHTTPPAHAQETPE